MIDIKYNPRKLPLSCYERADKELDGWDKNNSISLINEFKTVELELTYEESQISYVKKYLGMKYNQGCWACPF